MKRMLGYIVAFLAGTVLSGGVAMAATTLVQAEKGTSTVQLNGQVVETPPKLVYGGTTYVQLYSIEQALKQDGLGVSWDGTNFSMWDRVNLTPSSSTPINVSELPEKISYPGGIVLKINNVKAASTYTEIDITIENNGPSTVNIPYGILSDGGPAVKYVNLTGHLFDDTGVINTGMSLSGGLIFGPLEPGTTKFNWDFANFSGSPTSLTFNLNH